MNEPIMLQGHVIDPAELLSGTCEGPNIRLLFRNGEVIILRCVTVAESKEFMRLLGL